MKVFLARAAHTAESYLMEISTIGARDVLRTQETVTVEVCAAVVWIGEETRSRALETVRSLNSIRWHAISSSEDLPDGASVKCWEQNSHGICLRHADVVDIRVKRPCAHIPDVVTSELVSTANWVVKVQ